MGVLGGEGVVSPAQPPSPAKVSALPPNPPSQGSEGSSETRWLVIHKWARASQADCPPPGILDSGPVEGPMRTVPLSQLGGGFVIR